MCAKNSTLRPKLRIPAPKRAGVHVHDMKIMLQAAKSGYCTSVASEMGTKSGQKGIKVCTKKFHSEAETAFDVQKNCRLEQ